MLNVFQDFETLETPTVLFFAYFFLSIGQLVLNCSSEPVLETLETMVCLIKGVSLISITRVGQEVLS